MASEKQFSKINQSESMTGRAKFDLECSKCSSHKTSLNYRLCLLILLSLNAWITIFYHWFSAFSQLFCSFLIAFVSIPFPNYTLDHLLWYFNDNIRFKLCKYIRNGFHSVIGHIVRIKFGCFLHCSFVSSNALKILPFDEIYKIFVWLT